MNQSKPESLQVVNEISPDEEGGWRMDGVQCWHMAFHPSRARCTRRATWRAPDEERFIGGWRACDKHRLETDVPIIDDDEDPTPWCHVCGAMEKSDCPCGPIAENH